MITISQKSSSKCKSICFIFNKQNLYLKLTKANMSVISKDCDNRKVIFKGGTKKLRFKLVWLNIQNALCRLFERACRLLSKKCVSVFFLRHEIFKELQWTTRFEKYQKSLEDKFSFLKKIKRYRCTKTSCKFIFYTHIYQKTCFKECSKGKNNT